MLISVIVPVYNTEKYLGQAIDSILRQDGCELEILIINDGSTDRSAEVARAYLPQIRLFEQTNQGPAAARNRGIREARGDLISFLDADDFLADNALKTQLTFLEQHPQIAGVKGIMKIVDEDGVPIGSFPAVSALSGAALLRKSVFDQVGLFDPTLRIGEDFDWFMRLRETGLPIAVSPQILYFYRLHSTNTMRNINLQNCRMLEFLGQSLRRRRQNGESKAQPLATLIDR